MHVVADERPGVGVGVEVELARGGAGIILISSYLPEVYDLADTLHVFRKGRLVATHDHKVAGHEQVLTEAIGT